MREIIKAHVSVPRDKWEMAKVIVQFEDAPEGAWKQLFTFYQDELHFTSEEFIGLTEDQAFELFQKKDIAYLQS
jgi:hypothetical protein